MFIIYDSGNQMFAQTKLFSGQIFTLYHVILIVFITFQNRSILKITPVIQRVGILITRIIIHYLYGGSGWFVLLAHILMVKVI